MFFLLLLQISQLKYQIEEEMQKNKKLNGKIMALQEDIEKTVSSIRIKTVTGHVFIMSVLHLYVLVVCWIE